MKPFNLLVIATALLATMSIVYVAYSAINTLGQLDAVERERDGWQHADEILAALDLHQGQLVVDLGSGAGYFSLKLSPIVGSSGRVVAADLRKLSLAFLQARAALRGIRNIEVVVADPDNPHLPDRADAILICNTYHELRNPAAILQYAYHSLARGGRVVITDRSPADEPKAEHAVPSDIVQSTVIQAGFTIERVADPLFTDSHGEAWWLLAGRK